MHRVQGRTTQSGLSSGDVDQKFEERPRVLLLRGSKNMDAIWILIAMPFVGLICFVYLICRSGSSHAP
jgi:hypothetical protein